MAFDARGMEQRLARLEAELTPLIRGQRKQPVRIGAPGSSGTAVLWATPSQATWRGQPAVPAVIRSSPAVSGDVVATDADLLATAGVGYYLPGQQYPVIQDGDQYELVGAGIHAVVGVLQADLMAGETAELQVTGLSVGTITIEAPWPETDDGPMAEAGDTVAASWNDAAARWELTQATGCQDESIVPVEE